MHVFMKDLSRGAFTYAPPTIGQLARAMDVVNASSRIFAWVKSKDRRALRVSGHPSSGEGETCGTLQPSDNVKATP